MAIVKMRKLSLVGLEKEREGLLSALAETECVELATIEDIELTKRVVNESSMNELALKMSALESCLYSIQFFQTEKELVLTEEKKQGNKIEKDSIKAKDPIKERKFEIALDEVVSAPKREDFLFTKVVDVSRQLRAEINDIDLEVSKCKQHIRDLKPYENMDVAFSSISDTKNTCMILGILSNADKRVTDNLEVIFPNTEVALIEIEKSKYIALFICLKKDKENIKAKLAELSFTPCIFDYPVSAKQKIKEIKLNNNRLNKQRVELIKKGSALFEFEREIKLLYDCFNIAYQIELGNENICKTKDTFILDAWLPEDKEKTVEEMVNESTSINIMSFSDPTSDELPPTITKSNALVQPYRSITNLYDIPNYHEKDPNFFVGLFYFIFFGMMMGDAGYGIVITLGSLLLMKLLKAQGGTRDLLKIFAMGGVSTLIWGILFGSWFSIETDLWFLQPILFNPMEKPMSMMYLAIGMGIAQVAVGFALRAWNNIAKGKIFDAIVDDISWVLVMVGVALALVGMVLINNSTLTLVGAAIAVASLAVLVILGGRKSKKVFGKALGGFKNLYAIINIFSDVMSYLRLFGLGLATGVIATVFNTLGGTLLSGFLLPIGIVILLVGHTMNIAINLLGVYVHNNRLQYIEFFSKFYTGEGRLFKPLASETQYIIIIKK